MCLFFLFFFFSFKLKYKLMYFLRFQWQCCCVSGHAVSDVTSPADGSSCHVCVEPAEFTGRDRRHPAAPGALGAGAGGVQPAPAAQPAAQHHRGHQPGHFTGEAHLPALICACPKNMWAGLVQVKESSLDMRPNWKHSVGTKYAYGQCRILNS